jgi:hypothetical protein
MYKIIGADGKEYGPVTADVLRQWLAQGRLNAQTKVLANGATEWKPLAALPEFGLSAPSAPLTPPPVGVESQGAILDQVYGPALGLMLVAAFGFAWHVFWLVARLAFSGMALSRAEGPEPMFLLASGLGGVLVAILGILLSVAIFFGALKMKSLEHHGLAVTMSILAMIPCVGPCCVIGLPIGIWALVVLARPEVKSAFR